MRIFHKGKTLVSTLLNIIGLTFAFAALYIIIVQVHYDLTYNHGIKDSERIYSLATKDWFEEGKYGTTVNRPGSEDIIRYFPLIERGGMSVPIGAPNQIYLTEVSEPVNIREYLPESWKDMYILPDSARLTVLRKLLRPSRLKNL